MNKKSFTLVTNQKISYEEAGRKQLKSLQTLFQAMKIKSIAKILIAFPLIIFCIGLFFVMSTNIYFSTNLSDFVYAEDQIKNLPHRSTALILGAGVRRSGVPSDMLKDRLDAGYLLLKNKKVDYLILSGDNRFEHYNEPEAMKRYLLKRGANEKQLVLDYAGRRTYDSCFRAREIFEQEKIYVVTQDFHIIRSLFLCRSFDIDTIGIATSSKKYPTAWYNWIRDYLGLAYAFLDVKVLKPMPILGEKIEIEETFDEI